MICYTCKIITNYGLRSIVIYSRIILPWINIVLIIDFLHLTLRHLILVFHNVLYNIYESTYILKESHNQSVECFKVIHVASEILYICYFYFYFIVFFTLSSIFIIKWLCMSEVECNPIKSILMSLFNPSEFFMIALMQGIWNMLFTWWWYSEVRFKYLFIRGWPFFDIQVFNPCLPNYFTWLILVLQCFLIKLEWNSYWISLEIVRFIFSMNISLY